MQIAALTKRKEEKNLVAICLICFCGDCNQKMG